MASPAKAADWNGTTSTNWFTAGNWTPPAVPGAGTTANINAAPNAPNVASAGGTAGIVSIGSAVGATGSLSVTGSGTLSVAGGLFAVGDYGTGTLNVLSGGLLTTNTFTTIANNRGTIGTVTVSGAGSTWNVPFAYFWVGDSGDGTLNVTSGGHVVSTFTLGLGNDSTAKGHVLVSGAGSLLSSGLSDIASVAGSTGEVKVTGAGAQFTSSSVLNVGNAGEGTLSVESGGATSANSAVVGKAFKGTATVTGTGSTFAVSNSLTVGQNNGGVGTLKVENGGVVTSASGALGVNTGASGKADITGTGSKWTMTGALTSGQAASSGTGGLNILSGGQVGALSYTGYNSSKVKVDGTGSSLSLLGSSVASTTFSLGATGAANRLDVTGGASLTTRVTNLTTVVGSGVVANIAGAGTTWQASSIALGGAGTATMTVADGAAVTITGGSTPSLIVDGTGTPGLTISSGGSVVQGDATTGNFTVGESAAGTLRVDSGGTLSTRFSVLGENAGSNGQATLTGAGSTWTTRASLVLGFEGTAGLEITDGADLIGSRSATIAFAPGSVGTVRVSGAGSTWLLSEPPPLAGISNISVGAGGDGTLRIEAGARVAAQGVGVGSSYRDSLGTHVQTAGTGHLVVTGAGTKLDVNISSFQTLDAGGDGGTGVIDILDGAVATVVGQGHFGASANYIGSLPPQLLGSGTLNVNGIGSRVTYTQTLDIGEQATGFLNISNGGFVSNGDAYLGSFPNLVGSAGNGTATVTGAGSMWQTAGTLRVGDEGTGTLNVLAGGFTSNNNATIANSTNAIGTATVSGAGSVWQTTGTLRVGNNGTATLNLAEGGSATATGAASINARSTLNIGTGAGAGSLTAPSLANAGNLRFNHTGTTTFSVPISGAGTIVKDNTGTTLLTGTHTFTGTTTLNAGRFAVNGSMASSPITVNSGAILGGSGFAGATMVMSGGIVAPGNSIDTLTVPSVIFGAGSFFDVELEVPAADKLEVTGIATINGTALVRVTAAPGPYVGGAQYLILNAGTRVGAFGGVVDTSAFLDYTLDQSIPNQVWLRIATVANFVDVAETPNQRAAAGGLQGQGPGFPLFDAVALLDAASGRAAFDLASGEIHATTKGAMLEDSRFVREAILDRLHERFEAAFAVPPLGFADTGEPLTVASAAPAASLWGQGYGSWGRYAGDGNAATFERSLGGFVTGADVSREAWRVGLAGGYQAASIDVAARASTASVDSYQFGIYGSFDEGPIALRFGGVVAAHTIDTTRRIDIVGLTETLSARYGARSAQAFGEVAYRARFGGVDVEPFARLAGIALATDAFSETGGTAALSAAGENASLTVASFGARFGTTVPLGSTAVKLSGMIAWRHAIGDITPGASPAFAGGAPFTVAGVPIARDTLRLEAGAEWQMSARTTLALGYSGEIGAGVQDHGVKARFTIRF